MVTVGEVLKNKREKLKISIETASLDTKIQKRFLKFIENNEFFPFESEVFLTGFIKIYAKYLNLDVEKVLALYRRTNPIVEEKKIISPFNNLSSKKTSITITPKAIVISTLVLFSLAILFYFGIQVYKFQKPPVLSISTPQNNSTVKSSEIKVIGNTEKNVSIQINNISIEVDEDGSFEKEISLIEGKNLITIKAKKNNNSIMETVQTIQITFVRENEVSVEEVVNNKIKIEIFDAPAWIKLDIDNINKLSQVVQPSIQEFEIKSNIKIVSGRINNTKVFFNGQLLTWPKSNEKGVAEINCTVEDGNIVCQ